MISVIETEAAAVKAKLEAEIERACVPASWWKGLQRPQRQSTTRESPATVGLEGPASEFSKLDRACPPHQTASNCAVRWEKRKRAIEPGTSAARCHGLT